MGYAEFERYANDRLEDMLDAYANARLDPAGPVLARMRANVMAHAAAAAATHRVLDTPTLAPARSRFAWLQAPLPRRAMALGLAASLTLGTTAAVLAAPPGSPFYNARLVIETALMPSIADIDARLAAYEEQFDARITEAEAAAASGDTAGLAAALAAYQGEVDNAVADIGFDADRLARLEAVLAKHIAKLEALSARLPTEVARQNAVDHAITTSERAVDRINQKQAGGNQGGGGNGGNGGGNGGNGGNGPQSSPPHGPDERGTPEDDDSQ